MQRIDVVGMGARTPFGIGVERLFEGLLAGTPKYVQYAPFEQAGLKYPVAAPLANGCLDNADGMEHRGAQLLEGVLRDALRDAVGRHDIEGLGVPPARVGLFVGTSSAGVGALSSMFSGLPPPGFEARYGWEAEQVARRMGICGPVQVACSVCAAGAQAVAEAAAWLTSGAVDVALAAGYDVLKPFVGAGFTALGAYADRPMPFRVSRRGLVLGEAGAALVMTRLGGLEDRTTVKGVVEGWGSASDAFHVTAPHPDGDGVVTAARLALARAGLVPAHIDAINAHGTSTIYNDRMEARAFERLFGPRAGGLPVYTVKGTIGHTLGAAGALESIVSLASLRAGLLPPTATSGEPDPDCNLALVTEPTEASLRHTLSVSAGFGGVNCVLVLGGAP